jgi:tetratricopeptide (TPR) repeat protein
MLDKITPFRSVLAIAYVSMIPLCFGQSNIDIQKGLTDEQIERLNTIDNLSNQGDDLMAIDRFAEAAEKYRAVLAIDPANRGAAFALARAYSEMGRTKEAILLFRGAMKWRSENQDLDTYPIHPCTFAMRYALVLARDGQMNAAKAVYYFGLRNLYVPSFGPSIEPIPFSIVFDADPVAEVWTFSPKKLEAAAYMALSIQGDLIDTRDKCVKRARELASDWWYPVFYSAFIDPKTPTAEADFDKAEKLAGSEGRRTVLRKLREWKLELRPMPDYPNGNDIRPKMKVLQDARLRLRSSHPFASD